MPTTGEIIKQFAENLERDIKKAIPEATGETRASVHTVFRKEKGFDIFVGSQINQIIDGRGPTRPGAKTASGEISLQKKMLQFIIAKSIRPRESNMTQEALSWAFANSIHKKGYKGHGNIFANIITKTRLDSLSKTIINENLIVAQSNIIKNIEF